MKGLFWLLALFALAAAVALGIRYNSGYALFVLPPWRLEISLNLLAILSAVAFALGYLLLRGVLLTASLPQRARRYREQRRHARAEQAMQSAFRHHCAGRWLQALEFAGSAWQAGRDGGAAALLAAQAARCLRRDDEVAQWLARARAADVESAVAAALLAAEWALADGDARQALTLLTQLQSEHGVHVAALALELEARRRCGDWSAVLHLAHQLEKHGAMATAQATELRRQALCGVAASWQEGAAALLAWLAQRPADERLPEVLAAARPVLTATTLDEAADAALQGLLETTPVAWDGELKVLCGTLSGGNVAVRVAWAENRLAAVPDDPELLLALGRLCGTLQLWGKAERYLEAATSLAGTRAAHLELARLLDRLERSAEADRHYRLAAETAA